MQTLNLVFEFAFRNCAEMLVTAFLFGQSSRIQNAYFLSYHEGEAKNGFAPNILANTVPFLINRRHILLCLFKATTSSLKHGWSRNSILSQSRVPLHEKYITLIYALHNGDRSNVA